MKNKKFLSIVFTMLLALVLVACGGGSKEMTYNGAYLSQGTVGVEYSEQVARAEAEEATDITYALKAGDKLPNGLTLSSDGKITGKPTEAANVEITVVASAKGFKDAEATFIFTIVAEPATELTYNGKTLEKGATGASYSANVGTATGTSNIKYTLKSGNVLPAGLSITEAGLIVGTPTKEGTYKFVVIASAKDFDSKEAEFTIVIEKSTTATTFIMESEFVDLTDKGGGGWSGSARELNMIGKDEEGKNEASNGYFVAYTHAPNLSFDYKFTSDSAVQGDLVLRLGSDLGSVTLTPDAFEIKLNGVVINYTAINLLSDATMGSVGVFEDFKITTSNNKINILEGENILTLTVKENTLFPSRDETFGPAMDCVKITSTAILSWKPLLDNTKDR